MNAEYSPAVWQRINELVNQHSIQSNLKQLEKKLSFNRLLSENLLVFLLQYIGLSLNTLTIQPYPVWFASGTATAFLFLRGTTVLPGLWLGGFVAYAALKAGWWPALGCASVFTLQAYAIMRISYRLGNPTLLFYRQLSFFQFILSSLFITAIATVAIELICLPLLPARLSLWKLGLQWWFANLNGVVIIACAIIAWDAYFTEIHLLKKQNRWLLTALFGLLVVACVAALFAKFIVLAMLSILLMTYLLATIFSWCGAVAAIFILACLFTFGVSVAMPLFLHKTILITVSCSVIAIVSLSKGITELT